MHDSDDFRAFLNPILERPDDDEPRLIFADWLEEHGSPRGEFIRVQCELARLSDLDPNYGKLQSRSRELVGQHGHEWSKELKQDVKKILFHRGFIDTLTVLARALSKTHEELFSAAPVRWLRLNRVGGAGQMLVDSGAAERIRYLDMMNIKVPDEDLLPLLSGCTGLRGLQLGGFSVLFSSEVAAALRNAPFRQSLEHLDVQSEYENAGARNILAQLGEWPALRHLSITPVCGHDSDFENANLPSLRSLKIGGSLDVPRTTRLTAFPLSQLEDLNLQATTIPQAGLSLLASTGVFENVRRLDLSSCDAGIRSMEVLFRDNNLQNCETLDLTGTRRLAESASADQYPPLLAQHEALRGLKRLRISHLRRGQLATALAGPGLTGLEELCIQESALQREDVEAIARVLGPKLKRLHLVMSHVATDAMHVFADQEFPALFDFQFNTEFTYTFEHVPRTVNIEDPVIRMLTSGSLPRLSELSLQFIGLSTRTLDAFHEADLPHLRVFRFDGNVGSNEHLFQLLRSEEWNHLRLLSFKGCKGLRRGKKISEEFGPRLVY